MQNKGNNRLDLRSIFSDQELDQDFIDEWFQVLAAEHEEFASMVWEYQALTEEFIRKNAKMLNLELAESGYTIICCQQLSESFIVEMQLRGYFTNES